MKKRVKLLTTIASLCLAVALMAFGVYAAFGASVTVNGNISFGATDVDGSWTQVVVTVTGGKLYDGETAKGTTVTYTTDESKDGTDGFVYTATLSTIELDQIKADAAGTPVVVEIVATFTNTSNEVDASLTVGELTEAETDQDGSKNYTLAVTSAGGTAEANNSGTASATFTFTATDAAQSVNSDISAKFSAAK